MTRPNPDYKAESPEAFDVVSVRGEIYSEDGATTLFVLSKDGGPDAWTLRGDAATSSGVPVFPGLEFAAEVLRKGEVADVFIRGEKALPDGKPLRLRLEIIGIEKAATPFDVEDPAKLLEMADARRTAGDEKFPNDAKRALELYLSSTHCTGCLLLEFGRTREGDDCDRQLGIRAAESDRTKARALDCAARARAAACHLKLEQFAKARDECREVLKYEPDHVKARYRLGLALSRLHDSASGWDLAANEFRRCLELKPGDSAAANALATIERRIKAQGRRDRKRCGVMMAPVA